jgi:hypothetical protein
MGKRRGSYMGWAVKLGGMRPFGRSRRRLEGNIKMDLQEVEWAKDRGRW